MITTIIFDLGGVLFTNGAGRFITHLANRYSYKEVDLDAIISGPAGSAYRSGKMSSEEFWNMFKDAFPIPISAHELESTWESQYELIDETLAIIKRLQKTHRVYYLSDTVKKRVEYLENKYHFLSFFSGGIFSHEVGVRKPDPLIYKKVLELVSVDPKQSVFIDDKEKNLFPARALGMHTIHFVSPRQLTEELSTLLRQS